MTLTCVKCHQMTRDRPDARLPRPRGATGIAAKSFRSALMLRHLHADEPVAAGHPAGGVLVGQAVQRGIVAVPIFAGTSKRSARGPSGTLEVTGLRLWGVHLWRVMGGRTPTRGSCSGRSTAGRSHEGTTW